MTNEKKAFIGTIIIMVLISLSFLIKPIGTFFVRVVLGTLVLSLAIFLLAIIYNAIYQGILDMLDWLDIWNQNKK